MQGQVIANANAANQITVFDGGSHRCVGSTRPSGPASPFVQARMERGTAA
jgi:hypothetical protein